MLAMMNKAFRLPPILVAMVGLTSLQAFADISTRLSDTVNQGTGSINLLKDISAAQFTQQVSPAGRLFFGIDLNENAAGNETSASIGGALKSVQLTVTTTTGTYTFSSFATNTTASLTEAGSSTSGTYSTMFGQIGSSQLTSGTTGFDLASFDDVLVLNDVSFTGTVLSAQMSVQMLNTGNSRTENDTFFDYSGGYEDLALLSAQDAYALETASIGTAGAPAGVSVTTVSPTVTSTDVAAAGGSTTTTTTTTTDSGFTPSAAPAAPAPGLFAVLILCVLMIVGGGMRALKQRLVMNNLAS